MSKIISPTIEQNVKSVSNINSNQGKIKQRLGEARRHLFTKRGNLSQNLGCSKTSTSYTCLSDIKVYWELDNKSDNSAEH